MQGPSCFGCIGGLVVFLITIALAGILLCIPVIGTIIGAFVLLFGFLITLNLILTGGS